MNTDAINDIRKAAEAWPGFLSGEMLVGIARHLRACPDYEKLRGDADVIEAAGKLLKAVPKAKVLELCRLAEERTWQPIETAPRDGTRIMLGHPAYVDESGEKREGVSAQGQWFDGYADGPDDMGHDGGFMDCDFDCFSFPRSFGADKYRTKGLQPTHWMPLPEPPR